MNALANLETSKPYGQCTVEVNDIQMIGTVDPVLKLSFDILDDEFEGTFTHNEPILGGYSIHRFNELLRLLNSGIDIEFKSLNQYKKLIKQVKENTKGTHYLLDYGEHPDFEEYHTVQIIEKL